MPDSDLPPRIVTFSDWAHIGNRRNIALVRPDGNDSLVRRINEGRTTDADERYLESLRREPAPRHTATYGELINLKNQLEARYRVRPNDPETRLKLATQAATEIAKHTGRSKSQVWKMTIVEVSSLLAELPPHVGTDGRPRRETKWLNLRMEISRFRESKGRWPSRWPTKQEDAEAVCKEYNGAFAKRPRKKNSARNWPVARISDVQRVARDMSRGK